MSKNNYRYIRKIISIAFCLSLTSCLLIDEHPFKSEKPLLSDNEAEQFLNPEEIGHWFSYQPEAITLVSKEKMLPPFKVDKNINFEKNWDNYEKKHPRMAQYYRDRVTQHYLDKFGPFYEQFLNPSGIIFFWAWVENSAVQELDKFKKQLTEPLKAYSEGSLIFNDIILRLRNELPNEASFTETAYNELKQMGELPKIFQQLPNGTLLQYIGANKYSYTVERTILQSENQVHLIATQHESSNFLKKNYILQHTPYDDKKNKYGLSEYFFISKKRFGGWKIWLQDKATAESLWQGQRFKDKANLLTFATQVFNGIGFFEKSLSIVPLKREEVLFHRKMFETYHNISEQSKKLMDTKANSNE